MGSRQRKHLIPLRRFVLARRLDRNPLRRATDRLETVVLAMLAITFLAVAPFAGRAAGGWAQGMGHQAQVEQEASWRQVPAVVLTVVTRPQTYGGYAALQSTAQARWTAPDGKVVTSQVPVARDTAVGATVPVWVTRDGKLTGPPLQDSQVTGQALLAAMLSIVGLGAMLAIIGLLIRRVLDKRRMAAWDADWRATGPRWTTRA